MDMHALTAVQKYAATKTGHTARPERGQPTRRLAGFAMDFAQTLSAGQKQPAKQAMIGDADPHALVQALAQTELGCRDGRDGAQQSRRSVSGNPTDACLMLNEVIFL